MIHLTHALAHAKVCQPFHPCMNEEEAKAADSFIANMRAHNSFSTALSWEQSLYDSHGRISDQPGSPQNSASSKKSCLAQLLRTMQSQMTKLLLASSIVSTRAEASDHIHRGLGRIQLAIETLYEIALICRTSRTISLGANDLAPEVSLWGYEGFHVLNKHARPIHHGHWRRNLMCVDVDASLFATDDSQSGSDTRIAHPNAHVLVTVSSLGLSALDIHSGIHCHSPGAITHHPLHNPL